MEALNWIILTIISAILSLIITLSFGNIINDWLSPFLSKFSFSNSSRGITGYWKATFSYKGVQYTEIIRLKKFLGIIIGNIEPNPLNYKSLQNFHYKKPYRLSGQLYKDYLLTGTWKDPKDNHGFHGAYQLIISESENSMKGKWLGFNNDRTSIDEEVWTWEKINKEKPLFIAIYGVSGAGKTTLSKELSTKIDNAIYMSEYETIKSFFRDDFKQFIKLDEKERQRIREISLKEKIFELQKFDQDIVADCHFSFPADNLGTHGELKYPFQIVMPKICMEKYDIVIYLDTPPDLIIKRLPPNSSTYKNRSELDLRKWQMFEIENLKKVCETNRSQFFQINESEISDKIYIISEIVKKSKQLR